MKDSCDYVPINSPNIHNLDQISHWFVQQAAALQSTPVSLYGLANAQRTPYSD